MTGKRLTNSFIDELEKIVNSPDSENSNLYLTEDVKHIIKEARELLDYNEWLIALENTIDNLYEIDIRLPSYIINIAKDALGIRLGKYISALDEITL